MVQVRKIGSCK